jgi:carbamoyl-phosphate synthase large subunit
LDNIKTYTRALSKELNVIGLMNIQFAVKDKEIYILEVNQGLHAQFHMSANP